MAPRMELQKIQIFSYIDAETIRMLEDIFVSQAIPKGDFLIHFDEEVPGLYILEKGEVTVLAQDGKTALAVLAEGASFGEMSLLETGYKASAHIVVSSDSAQVLFCKNEIFLDLIRKEPRLSNPFYKGASILISDRLRNANQEIMKGYQFVASVLNESEFDAKLGKTRRVLDDTGTSLITQLFDVIPLLDQVIENYPDTEEPLEEIKDRIETVLFSEGQNFDRLSQQLDLILQHFANLKSIVNGGLPLDIKGDSDVFNDV